MVAIFIMVDFMKFFTKRFTLKNQELCDRMNLMQMRHTESLKAYVCNCNAQMNATPHMHKVTKNIFFLRWVAKVDGRRLVSSFQSFSRT